MSSAQLARWAFVTPQAMNAIITALHKQRLIRRRRDPRHGRILRISVTAKGQDVLEQCDRSMDVIEADMLSQLPVEAIATLKELLAECARSLEASRPSATV
jgi:DNA-binding MarR family transcriptional regulator